MMMFDVWLMIVREKIDEIDDVMMNDGYYHPVMIDYYGYFCENDDDHHHGYYYYDDHLKIIRMIKNIIIQSKYKLTFLSYS